MTAQLQVKLLLPSSCLAEHKDVLSLVAETSAGSYGFLPQRRDCTAAIVPGILTLESAGQGEIFYALDEGVLVKTGLNIVLSVRRALKGNDLNELHRKLTEEFLVLDEEERKEQHLKAKLESGFLKQFVNLHQN